MGDNARGEPLAADSAEGSAFYDEMWRRYGHLDAKSPAAFHRRRLVRRLVERHAAGAGRVVDIGCGQGELLVELARALPRARLFGADVSEQSLRRARDKNPEVELFALDLCAPNFERHHRDRLGSFDLVVCSEVVEHVDDDILAVRHLSLLLAPGGWLVLTVPGGRMSRFDERIGHQRHYSVGQLASLLQTTGLSPVELLAWGFPFQNLYRTAVRIASRAAIAEHPAEKAPSSARLDTGLGRAYELFGLALKPLFYFNLSRWGEQLLAVAQMPR
ncbi:MAG TPA: class I SAM-dependent methyltransferase [Polyangiaceae bacterium]|nr:class I SAM-dependent methyltransferase [Polyangiaceae bacterium]